MQPVSVVIIFYNQREYVQRAVSSVLAQTYADLDIVVVDDGSDESIDDLVMAFDDARIRFFRQENGGAASARNYGLNQTKNEWIAFLDGDDLFAPTKIERIMDYLKLRGFPECVVTSGHYVVSKRGWVLDRRMPAMGADARVVPFTEMYTSCSLYHRATIDRFCGFPEALRVNEDGALNVQIGLNFPIYGLAEPLTYYQVDNAGKARRSLQSYEWGVQVMEDRLAVVAEYATDAVSRDYRTISERNLFYGFLSCGNMGAARRWYKQRGAELIEKSWLGRVAQFSVWSGLNGYAVLREGMLLLKRMLFIKTSLAFKRGNL